MFIHLYNDIMLVLQLTAFAMICIIAVILMPYIMKFIISKMYSVLKFFGYAKSKYKKDDINFDEFDNFKNLEIIEKKEKEEVKHKYQVLEEVYHESFNKNYDQDSDSLDFIDILEAQKNVEKAKEDLYNFKVLDSVKVKNKKTPEGVAIKNIKENHKKFDVELFKNWSMQIFKCIKAKSKEELEILKKVMDDQLYNKLIFQIKEYEEDGLKFVTEDLIIKEVSFLDYGKRLSKETIKIFIKAEMKEYIIEKDSNTVIRGNKNKVLERKVVMTFLRQNKDEKEGFITNCPNCGGETTQLKFGNCTYCNTLVFPIRYNWTLVKFETI